MFGIAEEIVQELIAEASRALAGNPVLTLESLGIGAKPIPSDGEPVLGESAEIANLFVASATAVPRWHSSPASFSPSI